MEIEILLVEDNPADAELCIRSLRKHNLANNVLHLTDGTQALDYVYGRGEFLGKGNQRPSVIFLDLKLPKIDGLQVLKILKTDEMAKMIPVVIMTSSQEQRDIVESYRLGVNSYVTKPVDFDQFAKVVADLGMYWLLINQRSQ